MLERVLAALAILVLLPGAAGAETLTAGGQERHYSLFRPPALGRERPVPLVVMLHGGFGTAEQARRSYGWDEMAAAKGFVVVYPDGARRSWNAGGTCCGPAFRDQADDVGFLDTLIAAVASAENIDLRRIYIAGISNGGAMAYRYACEGRIRIAAIGSVSGTMTASCPNPPRVSVMEIHGLRDITIPFAGGVGSKGVSDVVWPPVEATLDHFRRAGHCGPAAVTSRDTVMRADAFCDEGRMVSLIAIADAGHQWPGAVPERPLISRLLRLEAPSRALDATTTLWSFFEGHLSGR